MLENLSQTLVLLLRLGYCPLTGYNQRVVTGLVTGHNTLRRHLYIMGLINSPLCWRCAAVDETSAHVLCECEALVKLRHTYLDSSFLDPKDVTSLYLGAIWNFIKETGITWFGHKFNRHKGPVKKVYVHHNWGIKPTYYSILFNSTLFYSILNSRLCKWVVFQNTCRFMKHRMLIWQMNC